MANYYSYNTSEKMCFDLVPTTGHLYSSIRLTVRSLSAKVELTGGHELSNQNNKCLSIAFCCYPILFQDHKSEIFLKQFFWILLSEVRYISVEI